MYCVACLTDTTSGIEDYLSDGKKIEIPLCSEKCVSVYVREKTSLSISAKSESEDDEPPRKKRKVAVSETLGGETEYEFDIEDATLQVVAILLLQQAVDSTSASRLCQTSSAVLNLCNTNISATTFYTPSLARLTWDTDILKVDKNPTDVPPLKLKFKTLPEKLAFFEIEEEVLRNIEKRKDTSEGFETAGIVLHLPGEVNLMVKNMAKNPFLTAFQNKILNSIDSSVDEIRKSDLNKLFPLVYVFQGLAKDLDPNVIDLLVNPKTNKKEAWLRPFQIMLNMTWSSPKNQRISSIIFESVASFLEELSPDGKDILVDPNRILTVSQLVSQTRGMQRYPRNADYFIELLSGQNPTVRPTDSQQEATLITCLSLRSHITSLLMPIIGNIRSEDELIVTVVRLRQSIQFVSRTYQHLSFVFPIVYNLFVHANDVLGRGERRSNTAVFSKVANLAWPPAGESGSFFEDLKRFKKEIPDQIIQRAIDSEIFSLDTARLISFFLSHLILEAPIKAQRDFLQSGEIYWNNLFMAHPRFWEQYDELDLRYLLFDREWLQHATA